MPEQIEDNEKKAKKITREQYRRYWIQASVVILAAFIIIIFYFCVKRYAGIGKGFSKLNSILSPIIIGFVLAFLMNPIMRALEKGMLPFSSPVQRMKKRQGTGSEMPARLFLLLSSLESLPFSFGQWYLSWLIRSMTS